MARRTFRLLVVAALAAPLLAVCSVLAWTALAHLRFVQYARHRRLDRPRFTPSSAAAYYAATCRAALRVSGWIAAHGLADRQRDPPGAHDEPPVVCVHGFGLVGATMWGVRQALETRGRSTVALYLGLPHREPATYVRALRLAMHRVVAAHPDGPLDLVAHSMGGLVVRLVLAEDFELARRVRRVVTLGTPHHGTALLRVFRLGPAYRMMSLGSELLRDLPTIRQSAPQAEVTTVASHHDFIAYPVECTHLEDARQVTLDGVSHLGLLVEDEVLDLVAGLLAPGAAAGEAA